MDRLFENKGVRFLYPSSRGWSLHHTSGSCARQEVRHGTGGVLLSVTMERVHPHKEAEQLTRDSNQQVLLKVESCQQVVSPEPVEIPVFALEPMQFVKTERTVVIRQDNKEETRKQVSLVGSHRVDEDRSIAVSILAECPEGAWDTFWPFMQDMLESLELSQAQVIWEVLEGGGLESGTLQQLPGSRRQVPPSPERAVSGEQG